MGGETNIFFNSSNARCRSGVHASGTPLRKHSVKGSAIAAYLGIKIRKYPVIPENPRSSEIDRGKGQLATQADLALSTSMPYADT